MKRSTLILMLCAASAFAQSKALTKVPVGLEGRILYRCGGTPLRAKPASHAARVVARIVSTVQDGDATLYDIRFIPQYAGRPDVRDALERIDGTSLADAPPAIVEITMALPLDHDGTLQISEAAAAPRFGGYRLLMVGALSLWCIPVLIAIGRRLMKRSSLPAPIALPAPLTLADQLRPLVDVIIEGKATLAEKAILERLLIAFWRERLSLQGLPAASALQAMRQDPAAGELLGAIESWLHKPARLSEVPPDVSLLLRPYAAAPQMPGGIGGPA